MLPTSGAENLIMHRSWEHKTERELVRYTLPSLGRTVFSRGMALGMEDEHKSPPSAVVSFVIRASYNLLFNHPHIAQHSNETDVGKSGDDAMGHHRGAHEEP